MYVHHMKNYLSSLLMLLLRLEHMFITQRITTVVYLTLVMCENIPMDREECLRRK